MAKTARAQAIEDIKAELKREQKSYINFRRELNPAMRDIVKAHILLMTKKGGHHV